MTKGVENNPEYQPTMGDIDEEARKLYPLVYRRHTEYCQILGLNDDDVKAWADDRQRTAGRQSFFESIIQGNALVTLEMQNGIYRYVYPMFALFHPEKYAKWRTLLFGFSSKSVEMKTGGTGTAWVSALDDPAHEELMAAITWQKERCGGRTVLPMIIPWNSLVISDSRIL